MAKEDAKATGDAPDPWAVLNRVAAALENMAARPQDADMSMKLGDALARLADTQLEGSKLIANETRRAARPSNEVHPGVSVFNQRGSILPDDATGPRKPNLKCVMLIPWIAEWESLTREEAELLNLLQTGEYTVKRIDNTRVRVTVKIEYKMDNVTPSRLVMTHETAYNKDNFRLMPSLVDILRGVLKQHDPDVAKAATAVMADEEEQELISAGLLTVSV